MNAAVLASVFVPLVSVFVSPALAQNEACPASSISGLVWFDTNNNGIQDPGENGIEGVVVSTLVGEARTISVETGTDGRYAFCGLFKNVDYPIKIAVLPGYQASPSNRGDSDAQDSDGVCCLVSQGSPDLVVAVIGLEGSSSTADFGFWQEASGQPGTRTLEYWKNQPTAWPVDAVVVGGVSYGRDQAIALLSDVASDMSITMFSALVPAMLNVLIGNDASCVADTVTAANAWMATYGPAGKAVTASSAAWKTGEPLRQLLDSYNHGMLCAPHRP